MDSGINDFAIKLANVNGSGSASANSLIMQAIFRMGVPVSGKNLFPSNIQGLPTWYEIRVNKDGYIARALDYDLIIAMNAQTYARDVSEVRSGGYILYDSSWPLDDSLIRDDITYIGVPLAQLCNESFRESRERVLMKNIATAGVLIELLNIDGEVVQKLIEEKYGRKKGLRESNQKALRLGADYVRSHFDCPLPFHLQTMDANGDKILIDGNTAAALGCVYAGATVAAWYPITPSTSAMDAFKAFCERFRTNKETGERNYLILQAEDELAAIGMVLGASWMGARAFTSTAGPGISLMNELLGLAYYAEIPVVVIDVQRVGPSTGMPTRTQQGDILECAYASHGDTRHILLFPANPSECFEFAVKSFDLAERFQTPVFMLTDLDIGMNDWVTPKLTWDDSFRPDRGLVLTERDLESIPKFERYIPQNGSAVAARTLPGVGAKGSFFTRGSGHNKVGAYTEVPDEYQDVMDRLLRKHKESAAFVPEPVIERRPGARAGIITIGGCDPAVREALDILDRQGMPMDYMRIRRTLPRISPLGLLAVLALAGCRQDMHDQPRFKPLAKSDFYGDLRSARAPVEGTIARGQLREDGYFYTGKVGNAPGDYMPFPANEDVLARGRERFDIYCSPCHSRLGDGNGVIVQRGYRRPPSYHTDRLRNAPLSYFFDVMTNGFGAMPDYASQISARDRWNIVAYIRALQLSQNATSTAVPAGQKMPSQAVVFRGDPGSGATLPEIQPNSDAGKEDQPK